MSILLEQMGKNEEAVKLLKEALAIVEKLEDSRAEQATTLTNLALLYFKLDKAKKAAAALNEALRIFEEEGNAEETDAHYSAALAGVGEVYYRMGDYANSLASYEKALIEVEKHFGKNQSYGVLCENCAAVCSSLKEEEKAEEDELNYMPRPDTLREKLRSMCRENKVAAASAVAFWELRKREREEL